MKVPPTGTEVTFRAVVTEEGLRIDVLEDNQTHDQVDLVLIVASIFGEGLRASGGVSGSTYRLGLELPDGRLQTAEE